MINFLGVLAALNLLSHPAAAPSWSQFRGLSGQGFSESYPLPLNWSEDNNVRWKTPIHGRAWSSPVVWADQIWLSTATNDGRQLFALCVDANTGKILHDLKLFEGVAAAVGVAAAAPSALVMGGRGRGMLRSAASLSGRRQRRSRTPWRAVERAGR